MNLVTFVYNRPVGWIDRTNSSTYSIWNPGKVLIHGNEGYGVYRVDENGYLNKGELIDDGYILTIGASYTQGKEVKCGRRYSDILNNNCREKGIIQDGELYVYNLSQDAFFLPNIINRFNCIIEEFPNSSAIVIEIGTTDFSSDELDNCIEQSDYNPEEQGGIIAKNLSTKKRLAFIIKEYLPITTQIRQQIESLSTGKIITDDNLLSETSIINDNKGIPKAELNKALSLIRQEYNGDLYILYHPAVQLSNDGMEIVMGKNVHVFEECCKANGIIFLNMADEFRYNYAKNYEVPYGFGNTIMGSGHLNESGHRAIANELSKAIFGEE